MKRPVAKLPAGAASDIKDRGGVARIASPVGERGEGDPEGRLLPSAWVARGSAGRWHSIEAVPVRELPVSDPARGGENIGRPRQPAFGGRRCYDGDRRWEGKDHGHGLPAV